MSLARCVQPEWLDHLDATDPRAARSRRDLQRVNRLMGNASILARALQRSGPSRVIVELGAGDGTLLLRIMQQIRWPGGTILFVDRRHIVSEKTRAAFASLGWKSDVIVDDAVGWLEQTSEPIETLLANLFLHHFETAALTQLLAGAAARADRFVACEPRRSAFALTGSRLLGLIGCNDVSRHDAVVSVCAGFAGHELSDLWPRSAPHRLDEYAAGLFSHCFIAQRGTT